MTAAAATLRGQKLLKHEPTTFRLDTAPGIGANMAIAENLVNFLLFAVSEGVNFRI